MQTVLRILERAGGYRPTLYLKIENQPYMTSVIEAVPPSPLPATAAADLVLEKANTKNHPNDSKVLTGSHHITSRKTVIHPDPEDGH